jgi:2-dehydro-3-deoxyphosphogluconate aldolase/(4S)-4-hydroxy-2-oxoglutarate aldolase
MPGFDEATVAWCLEHGVPVVPGVMTPTEIGGARSAGLDLPKFFPADATGGSGWLRSIAGVFPDVRFIPTGGIGVGNLGEYLRLPNVAACGGSWIVHRRLVARGEFGEITRLTSEAVGVVRAVRAEA